MNPRTTGYLIGGIVGAMLGILVAWILVEDAARGTEIGPGGQVSKRKRQLRPTDAINLVLSAIGLARQIDSLRQR